MIQAHPGAFCAPAGATGQTRTGTGMVCSVGPKGGRARWRSDGTKPVKTPRSRRGAAGNNSLPRVNTGITVDPAAVAPPPAAVDTTVPEAPVNPAPTHQPARATALPPVCDQALEPPNRGWGIDQGLMHFDGALGQLWQNLGDNRHLTVDGRPLGNVVKDLGEGITLNNHSSQQALDDLRRISRQLPADSTPGRLVDAAIRRLDAPAKPLPPLPDNTPPQLRTLAQELNAIPLVRRGGDEFMGASDPYHADDVVADIARRWSAGQLSAGKIDSELRAITRWGHEAIEGHEEMRRALGKAMRDVNTWGRRPR